MLTLTLVRNNKIQLTRQCPFFNTGILDLIHENWLTDYYIALYEIQATMGNKNADNAALLRDAKDYIDKLKIDIEANQSEICTV